MKKPLRMRELRRNQRKVARKAARHLPEKLAYVAFSYADNRPGKTVKGTFGAASPCHTFSAAEIDEMRGAYENAPREFD